MEKEIRMRNDITRMQHTIQEQQNTIDTLLHRVTELEAVNNAETLRRSKKEEKRIRRQRESQQQQQQQITQMVEAEVAKALATANFSVHSVQEARYEEKESQQACDQRQMVIEVMEQLVGLLVTQWSGGMCKSERNLTRLLKLWRLHDNQVHDGLTGLMVKCRICAGMHGDTEGHQ